MLEATAHFVLYVSDQAASRGFYEAVLGQPPRLDVPGMTEFGLSTRAVLGLMPASGIVRLLGPGIAPTRLTSGGAKAELYLLVPDPAEYHRRALCAGARELSPLQLRDWGHHVAYSIDADGHVLAFASP